MVKQRTMHKFKPADPKNSVAETLAAIIHDQLSNIPYMHTVTMPTFSGIAIC